MRSGRASIGLKFACGMAAALLLLGAAPAAAADRIIARWNGAEPETLDPQLSTGAPDGQVEQDLFEGLTRFSPDKKAIPGIADHWDISADGLTYTFHLRPDAKWSNGEPVTSADFLYSFRRLVDPKTASSDIDPIRAIVNAAEINAGKITDPAALGVAAPDPADLVFTLKHPDLAFLQELASRAAYPLPRPVVEANGGGWTRPDKIVTNGPFTLQSWVPHDQIVLRKNELYYGRDAIKLDEIRHVVVDDDKTAFLRWRAGELDITRAPTKGLAQIKEEFGAKLHHGTSRAITYMMVNMGRGPLGTDQRLREALNLAIDREALANQVSPRGEEPAYSYVAPVIQNYTPQRLAFQEMAQADRVARAKQLLAEAGYGPDHPLKLEVTYFTNEDVRTIVAAIRQMWLAIGVEATLTNEEFQVYMGTLNHKTFEVGLIGWNVGFDDPYQFLRIYRSDAGDLNNSAFADKDYDALLDQAGSALDLPTRRAALEAAERRLMSAMPVFPLFYGIVNMLVTDRVQGWTDNDQYTESRYLSIRE